MFRKSGIPLLIPIDISDDPNDPDVQAIAAFLRVLNALENIRSAIEVAERGRTMKGAADLRDLARLSHAETIDALEVLSGGAFAAQSDPAVSNARVRLRVARAALGLAKRLGIRWTIDELLGLAVRQLRVARDELANPATLPASFRN